MPIEQRGWDRETGTPGAHFQSSQPIGNLQVQLETLSQRKIRWSMIKEDTQEHPLAHTQTHTSQRTVYTSMETLVIATAKGMHSCQKGDT